MFIDSLFLIMIEMFLSNVILVKFEVEKLRPFGKSELPNEDLWPTKTLVDYIC